MQQGRPEAGYYLERALGLDPGMLRARRALDELRQRARPASGGR
jgi:hypothetical protein